MSDASQDWTWTFTSGWRFHRADVEGAEAVGFEDSAWQRVGVPHTYNDVDTFDDLMADGHAGERNMYTGPAWYRREFRIAPDDLDASFILEFDGVRQAAEVFLNGNPLSGVSENGFIPFGYDLTGLVREHNVLAVRVDNSFPYLDREHGEPLSWHDSHWHPTHGGIWRDVRLHRRDRLHLTLPLFSFLGTQGAYAYAESLSPERAEVCVQVEVRNADARDRAATVRVRVFDEAGVAAWTAQTGVEIAAGALQTVTLRGVIDDPTPWSPEHAYRYRVAIELLDAADAGSDTVIGAEDVELGLRQIEFTHDQGFFINGRALHLRGWGQRPTQEWAGLGAGYAGWLRTYILELMKEGGANLVRWGHAAGAPVDVASADALGVLTIQPGVDGEGTTVGGVYSDAAYRIRLDAFRDLIIRYRNSPSIIVWEGGNQSVPQDQARALRDLADTWDPHGGRVFAHRRCDLVMDPYVDLSIGTEGSWELKSRGQPVVEGEYNREEAPRRFWDRHTAGWSDYHAAAGSAYDLSSEELAANQARHFAKITTPGHSGGVNWIFSDSTSHGRVYSEVARVSGAVDAVMLPKEAYWSTRAIFRSDPQVLLIGHWNYEPGTVKDVFVTANTDSVRLELNGVPLPSPETRDEFLFVFAAVEWQPGELVAYGLDATGNVVAEQAKRTTGAPTQLRLSLVGEHAAVADDADVMLVDVEALDADGRRVPTAEDTVSFEVAGPARWCGGYNSGRPEATRSRQPALEAGINRIALRSSDEPGAVTVTATAANLAPASLDIAIAPASDAPQSRANREQVQRSTQDPGWGVGPSDEPQLRSTEAASAVFSDFSYSGPSEGAEVRIAAGIGDLIWPDRPAEFDLDIQDLLGGDQLVLPAADASYLALDLVHVTVAGGATITIWHDAAVPAPEWLTERFTPTDGDVAVEGRTLRPYRWTAPHDQTLTLGGNSDGAQADKDAAMYLVLGRAAQG